LGRSCVDVDAAGGGHSKDAEKRRREENGWMEG
jgi:hypothetical protein